MQAGLITPHGGISVRLRIIRGVISPFAVWERESPTQSRRPVVLTGVIQRHTLGQLAELLGAKSRVRGVSRPSWPVRSGDLAAALTHRPDNQPVLDLRRLGIISGDLRDPAAAVLAFARVERMHLDGILLDALRADRCVVPISAFVSWVRPGEPSQHLPPQPRIVGGKGGALMFAAGICQHGYPDAPRMALLTLPDPDGPPSLRVPALLDADGVAEWFGSSRMRPSKPLEGLAEYLALLRPLATSRRWVWRATAEPPKAGQDAVQHPLLTAGAGQ